MTAVGLFSELKKRFSRKDPDGVRFRREAAARIAGHRIRYVTERAEDNTDEVIGRDGSLSLRNDEFIVFSSGEIVFRCPVDDMSSSELLSKDGVILEGPDLEHGGRTRKIIVYYVYYL